jgi:DNA-binding response OmpR family regulator
MSKHVLIAEDDTLLAEMMGKILSKNNVRVTIAYDGQEAVEEMEKKVPDLLLLDILLPVLDGFGVMKTMKEKNLACDVIVLSNLSDKVTQTKCREMQVKNYFVKNDMDDDALWPAIEKYLR